MLSVQSNLLNNFELLIYLNIFLNCFIPIQAIQISLTKYILLFCWIDVVELITEEPHEMVDNGWRLVGVEVESSVFFCHRVGHSIQPLGIAYVSSVIQTNKMAI